jgi:serine/threonine protein kinase
MRTNAVSFSLTRSETRFQTAEAFHQALDLAAEPSTLIVGNAAVDISPGILVDGTYRVVRQLGEGSAGQVFHASDEALDRPCAVKVLRREYAEDSEVRERFLRDGKLAARIENRHLVRVYRAAEWRGNLYLAMELVEGETLAERLPRMSWLELVDATGQVAQALDALAAEGIVHRDLAPDNILVDRAGAAKVIDLGIARSARSELTRTGAPYPLGREGYMAPEHARSAKEVTPASDQWSLAAIVYETLTGNAPYLDPESPASSDYNALYDVLTSGEPPRSVRSLNRGVPAPVSAVVDRALSPDPTRRFPRVAAFAEALKAAAGRRQIPLAIREQSDPRTTVPGHRRKPSRPSKMWLLPAEVAIGAAVVATGLWAARPSPRATAKKTAPAAALSGELTLRANALQATAIVQGKRISLPATLTRPLGTQLDATIEASGFKPKPLALVFTAAKETASVELERIAPDLPVPQAKPQDGSARHASSSKRKRDEAPRGVRVRIEDVPPEDGVLKKE